MNVFKIEIREIFYSNSKSSFYFNIFMQLTILASVISVLGYDEAIPVYIGSPKIYRTIEIVAILIFLLEFILKITAMIQEKKKIEKYPFYKNFLAVSTVIDILSFVPYYFLPYPYRILVLLARLSKTFRFSRNAKDMMLSFQDKAFELTVVFFIFLFFLFSSSVVMFAVEYQKNPQIKTLFDAFWWSIVTITTVGYGDKIPQTQTGKVIASFLMILGISGIAVLTGIFSSAFTERLLKLKLNMGGVMEQKISKLSSHMIVCGYGRVGKVIAREFEKFNKQFVIIEKNRSYIQEAIEHGFLVIEGDATDDEILKKANIKTASGIALVMDSDADNLYTLISAKDENKDILAIARVNTEESVKKFVRLGAKTVSPFQASGYDISRMLISPRTAEFVSIVMQSDQTIEMGEFYIGKQSRYANQTIIDTHIRDEFNMIIIAVIEKSKNTIFNPKAKYLIKEGCTLICVGKKEDMEKFEKAILS